ncbi:MAG: thiosulfate oxidation carrier protein SoxY [Hyphomicrobium sp.]|jgi:sulfur-oxidizing protein SoxY
MQTPDRRQVLIGAGALTCATVFVDARALAEDQPTTPDTSPAAPSPVPIAPEVPVAPAVDAPKPEPHDAETSPQYQEALKRLLGDATPLEERVTVDIPEAVENGNIVPYRLEVQSEMNEQDSIKRLHLFSTANPQASVAVFHFTALSAKATVIGRMRLAKSQDVVAVAETHTGAFLIGRRAVKVDIAGCGNE